MTPRALWVLVGILILALLLVIGMRREARSACPGPSVRDVISTGESRGEKFYYAIRHESLAERYALYLTGEPVDNVDLVILMQWAPERFRLIVFREDHACMEWPLIEGPLDSPVDVLLR